MYSQNNEEEVILESLSQAEPKGTFLDIGAYDGKTFSNTLRLVELGWSGVCVEPCPIAFKQLLGLHRDNPVQLLNVGISVAGGMATFSTSNGDAVSTLSESHVALWSPHINFAKFWINTVSVAALFQQFGTDFDFINLDVEGLNMDIFNAIPWESMTKLRCACIEHEGHWFEIEQKLGALGFTKTGLNGENIILRRDA